MVMKLITEAGYYNGVFKPAGQTYDDGTVGTDDAPADLTAPGPIDAENTEAGAAGTLFLDDSGLTGQVSAQSDNIEGQTSEGSSSIPAAPVAQPAPIPVLDAVQGEEKA